MVEICSEYPTHYSKRHQTCSFIDRAFISMQGHYLLETSVSFDIWQEAASLAEWGLSDHAIIQLTIRPRQAAAAMERAIPANVFASPRFAKHVKAFLDVTSLDALGIEGRWRAIKVMMIEAARLARNELQSLPIGDGSEEGADGRRISARAVARAIWRQDRALAQKLQDTTEFGRHHLQLNEDGSIALADPEHFEQTCRLLHAAWHERQQRAAAQRLHEEARLRPGGDGQSVLQLRKLQRTSQRRALLWVPYRRRLILAGVRMDAEGHSTSAERDPMVIMDSLRRHWGPIFTDQPIDETAAQDYIDQHLPDFPAPRLEVPSPDALRAAFRRARRRRAPTAFGPRPGSWTIA